MTEITDNDIKKALECCGRLKGQDCDTCPLTELQLSECTAKVATESLDLINRQQAEIEKLNVELVGMRGACKSYKMHYDKTQTEIERLQKENKITREYLHDNGLEWDLLSYSKRKEHN